MSPAMAMPTNIAATTSKIIVAHMIRPARSMGTSGQQATGACPRCFRTGKVEYALTATSQQIPGAFQFLKKQKDYIPENLIGRRGAHAFHTLFPRVCS
jgi:hypothetical protein